MEFGFLSRVICAKNAWKSSAIARNEILKREFSYLTRNSKRLFLSNDKNLYRIQCLVRKLKSFIANNLVRFDAASSRERYPNITEPFRWKEGARSKSVEEITLQVPTLGRPFAIFIDLCSCGLESFTARVNRLIDA